jgi:hypothetical protein
MSNNAVPHVYTAISAVMANLAKNGISKERRNDSQGYAFRGIDDVYNALAPALSEHGLCILPQVKGRSVTEKVNSRGNTLFYVCVDVDFAFVSIKDGSHHTVSVSGEAMDSGDKATNKAMSAAYKYACIQAFCIPTEGDNDADSSTHTIAPATVSQTKPTAKTPALVGESNVETITKLASQAGVDLSAICSAYGIGNITELPLTNVGAVVKKLQSKLTVTTEPA